MRVLQTDTRGSSVTTQAVSDLAKATQQALDIDPVQRDSPAPTAAYVQAIQEKFDLLRVDTIAGPYHVTTDPKLLADPDFAAHLRDLFKAQASDSLAAAALDNDRVIGGSPIPAAKDVVSIVDTIDGSVGQICSGVLIDSWHVLTAGHCVCLGVNMRVQTGQTVFGTNWNSAYLVNHDPQYPELFPGVRCPAMDPHDDNAAREDKIAQALKGYDLAVLRLTRPVASNRGSPDRLLGPAAFARWQASPQNNFVRVGGFGFSAVWANTGIPDPDSTGVLNFADLAIPAPACRPGDATTFGCVPGRDLIAATNPNMNVPSGINSGQTSPDACNGDSGGPAYAQVKLANVAAFYPIAITSRATTAGKCGAGSIYTLLAAADVRQWLARNGATFTD